MSNWPIPETVLGALYICPPSVDPLAMISLVPSPCESVNPR
jgi:hypothetical protein